MSESTITIQNTIDYVKRYLRNRPLAIGDSLEPAKTAANLVKSTVQGPPLRWRWNRSVAQFDCVSGTQDYIVSLTDFGYIESAAIQDPTDNSWHPLEVKIGQELDSTPGRPAFISAQSDSAGSIGTRIEFRLIPNPDQPYVISITYQEQDTLLTSLNEVWGIPDEYMHIFTWGFMALMGLFAGDTTVYQLGNAKFVSTLLAAQQGLDQTQVNVFLNNWQSIAGTQVANSAQMTQGQNSRGV